MRKGLVISIIILVLAVLAGFSIGYFLARETDPAPIIIEKYSG